MKKFISDIHFKSLSFNLYSDFNDDNYRLYKRFISFVFLLLVFACRAKGQLDGDTLVTSKVFKNIGSSYFKVSAIEKYKGSYYIVDGTSDPMSLYGRNGLLRVDQNKNYSHFSSSKGNLSTDLVFTVVNFRDTLLIGTSDGVKMLQGDSFVDWKNKRDTVYRLTVWKNNLLMATPEGVKLYTQGSMFDLNRILGCSYGSVFHADMNDKALVVCYKDTVLRYDLMSREIKKYKINLLSKYVNWAAFAIDDFVIIPGVKSIKLGELHCLVIRGGGDTLAPFESLIDYCSPELQPKFDNGSRLPLQFVKTSTGFKMHVRKTTFLDIHYITEWSDKKLNTNMIYPDHFDRFRYGELLHIDDDYAFTINYNRDVVYQTDRNIYDSIMGEQGRRCYKLNRNELLFGVGYENFNSYVDMNAISLKSENCRIFSYGRALWIGGKTETGDLRLAATTYLQRGNDFFPGPLRKNGTTDSALMARYKKVWLMEKETIEAHLAVVQKSGKNNQVPVSIKSWPAYEVDGTDTISIAPWHDANKNGYYDPENGDYPVIKGHQAIFWVMNDNGGLHSESVGKPLKIQVNGMAYVYDCQANLQDSLDFFLKHAAFVDYNIVYRGTEKLTDVFMGEWVDHDLGDYLDDAIGSAPLYQTGFTINADAWDTGLKTDKNNPGALAVTILKGPVAKTGDGIDNDNNGVVDEADEKCRMAGFSSYQNSADPVRGNPHRAPEFYNYLRSNYINGQPFVKSSAAGVRRTRHLFSHGLDPNHPGWHWTQQRTDTLTTGDQRLLITCGSFELNPGDEVPFHLVHYYARNSKDSNQLPTIIKGAQHLTAVYNGEQIPDCWMLNTDKKQMQSSVPLMVYPNPSKDKVWVSSPVNGSLCVFDMNGRQMLSMSKQTQQLEIPMAQFSTGIYFIQLISSEGTATSRLILNK